MYKISTFVYRFSSFNIRFAGLLKRYLVDLWQFHGNNALRNSKNTALTRV